nr:hypothetical protein [Angustibacter aerolatus]
MGYGGSSTGLSGGAANDRHVYMSNNGRLNFGVNASGKQVITSPLAYNDNKWHLATASLGADGMKPVRRRLAGGRERDRHHGERAAGLLAGGRRPGERLGERAVEPTGSAAPSTRSPCTTRCSRRPPCCATSRLASGPLPNVLPTASFTTSSTGSSASVDGTASSDTDGTIVVRLAVGRRGHLDRCHVEPRLRGRRHLHRHADRHRQLRWHGQHHALGDGREPAGEPEAGGLGLGLGHRPGGHRRRVGVERPRRHGRLLRLGLR